MLKVDANLHQIPLTADDLIDLHESINLPLVSIPGIGAAPTGAFVIGAHRTTGAFGVLVCLRQSENDANMVYVSDPPDLGRDQYRAEMAEALRFVESMGFLMNDLNARGMSPAAKADLVAKSPIFSGPAPRDRTLDLVDLVEEGPGASAQPDGIALFGGLVPMVQGSPAGQGRPPHQGQGTPLPGRGRESLSPRIVQGEAPPIDPAARARLGRFLATFALLAAIHQGGCAARQHGIELAPELQTQVDIAEQQLAQAQFADAIKTLTPVLEEAPEAPAVLHDMGLAYLYLGRITTAEGLFRRAVDADPKMSVAKNSLATVLIEKGSCLEAERLLLEVVSDIFYKTPDLAENNLARAEHCGGRPKDALRRLENLVLRRPHFCRGYLTLAELAASDRQPELTISACEHFAAQCEEHQEIKKLVSPELSCLCYLRKGMAYAALGDVESARRSLSRCESDGTYGRECRRSLELLEARLGEGSEGQ